MLETSKRKTSEVSPTQTILRLSGEMEQWFIAAGSLIDPSLRHLSTFHILIEWSLFLDKMRVWLSNKTYPISALLVPSRAT